MSRMKGHLLCFSKEIIGISIECKSPYKLNRHQFFGDDLGRIEQVKFKFMFIFLRNDLHAEIPFRKSSILNAFPQITTMKIRILAGDLLCFIPGYRTYSQQWLPVKLYKMTFAFFIDQPEGVNAKTFHHA